MSLYTVQRYLSRDVAKLAGQPVATHDLTRILATNGPDLIAPGIATGTAAPAASTAGTVELAGRHTRLCGTCGYLQWAPMTLWRYR